MSESPKNNTVYLITGANRGIGLGLVKAFLARDDTTVIGTVRNQDKARRLEKSSADWVRGTNSVFYTSVLDLAGNEPPSTTRNRFISSMESMIDGIDVLICNAGIGSSFTTILQATHETLRDEFQINTIGTIRTFQTFWPLMRKKWSGGTDDPKLIFISSSLGCIADMEGLPCGGYGPSKAAINYVARKLHFELEQDSVISIAIHPGWIDTEMGQQAAREWGYEGDHPQTLDQGVNGIVKIVDVATRGTLSGKMLSFNGEIMNW